MNTIVKEVYVRKVLNRHRRRDEWFLDDYSLNHYYLCGFNCVYCYIRSGRYGRKEVRELSVKVNAPRVLDKELSRLARAGRYGFIALSSATEPWQQIEEKYKVTRRCLEVISRYRFLVHCLTKSTLILRDVEVLKKISEAAILPADLKDVSGVLVTFSFSTLREDVARVFEPGAPTPRDRLEATEKLQNEGFTCGLAFIPVLPFISDSELEDMATVARDLGVDYVFFSPPTLQGECRESFMRVVKTHFPELSAKYLKLYNRRWFPSKTYVASFYRRVKELCEKYGLKFGAKPVNLEKLASSPR